jgi:hypothetical protein
MYPETPGLIAAGSHYPAVAHPAHKQRLVAEFTVDQPLYRHEKSIQVQV